MAFLVAGRFFDVSADQARLLTCPGLDMLGPVAVSRAPHLLHEEEEQGRGRDRSHSQATRATARHEQIEFWAPTGKAESEDRGDSSAAPDGY